MTRALGTVGLAVLAAWVVAHVLYIRPVEAALEATVVWILVFVIASLVLAAVVLLVAGLALGASRPVWVKFVRAARTVATVAGGALVLVGLIHYRDTAPRGEIHWLALGVVVLLGAGALHWWLARRAAA